MVKPYMVNENTFKFFLPQIIFDIDITQKIKWKGNDYNGNVVAQVNDFGITFEVRFFKKNGNLKFKIENLDIDFDDFHLDFDNPVFKTLYTLVSFKFIQRSMIKAITNPILDEQSEKTNLEEFMKF